MELPEQLRSPAFARVSGFLLVGLGFSVLLGWMAGIQSLLTVFPGYIAMKSNTAICFMCAGIALLSLTHPATRRSRAAGLIAASIVLATGLLTVMEYLLHLHLALDQLLFRDPLPYPFPGRMAHITALNFCLSGAGLLLLLISENQAKWTQLLSLLTGFSATLAIIGYLYGVPLLYGSTEYTSMALHTGVGFLVLSAAMLHCRPTLGPMAVVISPYAGGWLARRLLPAAVIVPTLLGAVYLRGPASHTNGRLALALLMVAQILLFVLLVWALAYLLNHMQKEKEEAQKALRHSEELHEERYRTMFEGAIVGMFQSTPDGRFLRVNAAMAQMFGYSSPEDMIAGITAISTQVFVDAERSAEFVSLMREQGAVQNFELQAHRKNGTTMWISANVRAVRENGEIVRYEGTNSDITERKGLEEQLAQAQKMEAVGRLAGGVAHDFNNAIGVIVGYGALLKDRVESDAKAGNYIDQIVKAGQRAASLTRQLLAFSRKQVIQPAVLDLNAVVSDTDKMLSRLIGEDIKMTVNLAHDLGAIKADRGQIEQVLMNLVVNARDAMPQGGKLIIETQNAELDQSAVGPHPYAKPGDYVVLSVSDTGCGMNKETQAHIFEPFFTTKALGKGTGLGLSTVYGVVKQNEGYVWVYSELGQGARFKVYFPRIAATVQPTTASPDTMTSPGGVETILLVEDDDTMRELTRRCLVSAGYAVISTPNGEAAIQAASEHRGPVHLLLTDVVMPVISGRQLAESLAAYRPETRVLYMSGYTADLIADHGVLASIIVLLEKPFTKEDLLRCVRRVLDGGHRVEWAAAGI